MVSYLKLRLGVKKEVNFPESLKSVILESHIPPNANYFEDNSENFAKSLETLFKKCD